MELQRERVGWKMTHDNLCLHSCLPRFPRTRSKTITTTLQSLPLPPFPV
jgi:hypothetical protein